jgi:hypothetical protein
MKIFNFFWLVVGCLVSVKTHAQLNYFDKLTSIQFNQQKFHLVWSAHPTLNYYKQEYILQDETLDSFNKMVIVEVIVNNADIESMVETQVSTIKKIKEHDPVANYQLLENSAANEYLLDFVIHHDGIYEWSAYKYMPYGKKGTVLFGFVIRSFDKGKMNLKEFLKFLENGRSTIVNKMLQFKIPDFQIVNE